MDEETQRRFRELWDSQPRKKLRDIAAELGYSFASLAKLRMLMGLKKRYGADDDGEIPMPFVIKLRCLEQQTNWTECERRRRWCGTPHTIYDSVSTCDCQP